MQILTFPESKVPAALRAQARRVQQEEWPRDPGAELGPPDVIHDQALRPISMLLVDGETVLASLEILSKSITHGGKQLEAGGLSTVVVSRAARGKGHGRRLVVAAREAMPALGLDVGLFTCDRSLRHFYEDAGWQVLPGTVLVGGTPTNPFPSDQPSFDKVTLGAFFTPNGRAAQASFENCRVELYPGDIDKLW